ncbi:hypothetical protein [Sphingopyxis sp. 550A]
MGFFANLRDARWKPSLTDPVSSTAQVVSSTMQAEQVADRINASGWDAKAGGEPLGAFFGMPASVTINGEPTTAKALSAFETMTGMDLNGDGRVGGHGGQAIGEEAATDGANKLRHLQTLRGDGLISEAGYQAKRADILSGL